MRSGFSLLGLIFAVMLISLLTGGVLLLMSTGTFESVRAWQKAQAFCAAESGVSAARHYMDITEDWENNAPVTISGVVQQASFRAVIQSNAQVTSVGQFGQAQWTSIWTASVVTVSGNIVINFEGGLTDLNIAFFPGISGDMGQSFTTPKSDIVASAVALRIKKDNPLMSPIYLTLRQTQTTGPIIATSDTKKASQISYLSRWVIFVFKSPARLNKNTKYYIRVSSVPTSTHPLFGGVGSLIWRYNAALLGIGGYSGGEAWRYIGRNNNESNKGENPWPMDHDFQFRVYD